MKVEEIQHAMVEIKYGITTGLPVGKGSKLKVFCMRRNTSVNLDQALTEISKVAHHIMKIDWKNMCTLMWC